MIVNMTWIGKCSITNKMMTEKDVVVTSNTLYPLMAVEISCQCHDKPIMYTQQIDIVEERDDGTYWMGEGP